MLNISGILNTVMNDDAPVRAPAADLTAEPETPRICRRVPAGERRRGMSLVELLIVVVIIAVLAGGMLLSSGSASDTAKATTIISNLRGLKAASIMLFEDSKDEMYAIVGKLDSRIDMLAKYMDNPEQFREDGNLYGFVELGSQWWVSCLMVNAESGVKEKLASKASSLGLFGSARSDDIPSLYAPEFDRVYMRVR